MTIAKGQHLGSLHVEVSSSMLDGNHLYVLPLKIVSASGITISGNFGNGYRQMIAANPYVGLYQSVGYKKDVGVITNINQQKYLYFADPNPALGLGYVGSARGEIPLFNNGPCVYDPVNKVFTLNYAYVNAYGNTGSLHEVLTWIPLPQQARDALRTDVINCNTNS